ncbi:DUF3592 domain-containing protein [Burkholderia sp. Bp8963]|uniref:DUF3592 domain-containing protein n=1 Tax=Burkholderia sp. Bp8963 TaxID=2184547 RepID=UPI000F59A4C5|nr:DUF3592 domain-containing protein [Burkholderia sp. Bp8963]RQS58929.1 DUF3592 domain-containing protein [Burkholderia sp. Bp8963]
MTVTPTAILRQSVLDYVFLAIAGIALAVAFYCHLHRAWEKEGMVPVTGIVVNAGGHFSGNRSASARVEFVVEQRRHFVTTAVAGGYHKDEVVPVLYDPVNPQRALVNTFLDNWFISLLLGGIGTIFLSGGVLLLWIQHRAQGFWKHISGEDADALYARLSRSRRSRSISTRLQEIRCNETFCVNGIHPWQLVCVGQDESGQRLEFESPYLWSDPSSFVTEWQAFTVLVDLKNLQRYAIDLSALSGEVMRQPPLAPARQVSQEAFNDFFYRGKPLPDEHMGD